MKRWVFAALLLASLLGTIGISPSLAAQTAPTATPPRTFEVEDGRLIGLSPDGTMYAVAIGSAALCVFDAATLAQIACSPLDALDSGLRFDDIVWSPDSTRLAFAERGFVFGTDGDLWVMDARSGQLANITDDGYQGSILPLDDARKNATYFVDVAPAWTPDSQFITFSRSGFVDGERTGNVIAQVPAAGGEAETLATVSTTEPGVVYFRTGWSPDGQIFYFSLAHIDSDDPENGIWTYDRASGQTAQFATADDPELGPLALMQVSPAGDRLLAWYPQAYARFSTDAELFRLVDIADGSLTLLPQPETATPLVTPRTVAGFSPDGQALLQLVRPRDAESQLWVTDLATGTQTMLLDELEDATIEPGLTPTWGANGNAAIGQGIGFGYLTTIEGIGLPAASSPATAAASPAAGTPIFAANSDVQTSGLAPMFAGPDANSPVVAFLPPDHIVHVLAEPVQNDQGVWYPVFDPETQIIGYVQANRLKERA